MQTIKELLESNKGDFLMIIENCKKYLEDGQQLDLNEKDVSHFIYGFSYLEKIEELLGDCHHVEGIIEKNQLYLCDDYFNYFKADYNDLELFVLATQYEIYRENFFKNKNSITV